ncbi:MAG: VWA domain-containing protein [Planctomycetota bacterium]
MICAKVETIYEFTRLASLEGWWAWASAIGLLAAVGVGVTWLQRRDTVDLQPMVRFALLISRLAVVFALVFFLGDLIRRKQRTIEHPSEVVVVTDTSQSMSMPAEDQSGELSDESRMAQWKPQLEESGWLERLSQDHRVSIYTAGAEDRAELIAAYDVANSQDALAAQEQTPSVSRVGWIAAFVVVIGLMTALVSMLIGAFGPTNVVSGGRRLPHAAAVVLLVSVGLLSVGIPWLGTIWAMETSRSMLGLLTGRMESLDEGSGADSESQADGGDSDSSQDSGAPIENERPVYDWDNLQSAAAKSRLGDAVAGVLAGHDPSTLAGIVLATDGQNSEGRSLSSSASLARAAGVAVYPVGLGSQRMPTNVRVVDLDAPRRVYPEDRFLVTAVLQASGPDEMDLDVQLLDKLDNASAPPTGAGDASDLGALIETKKIKISGDGSLQSVEFEIEPESVGRRRLAIRVVAPEDDVDSRDDSQSAVYEVVARKLNVLLVAGGPTREYRFVRNLFFRDKSIVVDAWLQTGNMQSSMDGMSQDVDQLLDEFPATTAELFEYDAAILFDPDWDQLTSANLEIIDRWLSEQAGGMMLVAGPIYHTRPLRRRSDPRTTQIAGFFPVNVRSSNPLIGSGRAGGDQAWPLELTSEALRSEFFNVSSTPEESQEVWQDFDGVYDYVDASSAKPGAKVYAYFSDPTAVISDAKPIFMASQFYGAGRVYFQGSGEMWRLRGESDAYFDAYYTKLVRYLAEGRLLRDGRRGVLLIDSPRAMLGEPIAVRGVLLDEQFEPLEAESVNAKLVLPDGQTRDLLLRAAPGSTGGSFTGQFLSTMPGDHQVRLTIGDALSSEVLSARVQVRLPTAELERPLRNDDGLSSLAATTGGEYFPVGASMSVDEVTQTLLATMAPQPRTTILPGTPDREFLVRRNAVFLWWIATMLTMEWIVRRLHRLA